VKNKAKFKNKLIYGIAICVVVISSFIGKNSNLNIQKEITTFTKHKQLFHWN
jgi:hypothetical protein